MWLKLDEEGRITSLVDDVAYSTEDMVEFELPPDFDISAISDYRVSEGELIHDPLPASPDVIAAIEDAERKAQVELAIEFYIRGTAETLTDKQALQFSLLFEEWEPDHQYNQGEIVRYENDIYRIGQTHTSQEQWTPGSEGVEALYSKIEYSEEGYEVWKPWDGVSGIYAEGQVVKDPIDNNLYVSKIPNNVWGPPSQMSDYWELQEEGGSDGLASS